MQTNAFAIWSARAATFTLAALAALSGTYWILKSTQTNSVSTAATVATPGPSPLDPLAVARALGGGNVAPAAAATSGRNAYVLMGVIAAGSKGGAALIAVDGKPPKPFRVGASVDGNLVLQSVAPRRATLAAGVDGPAQMTLELPPLSK
jgi:general secretion pathway protein C